MRTQRLFRLLETLRGRRQPVPAHELAEAAGVSLRTLYRDMADLQAMGAPVRGASGLGYQLDAGYFLPPLNFDADERDVIMLGTRLIAARGDEALAEAARRVAAKVAAIMPAASRQQFERLPLRAASANGDASAHVPGLMRTLRHAVRHRAVLSVEYVDLQARHSQRTLRPLGLTLFDQTWLLTAWCELRDDFRNFRLDRLQSARLTGQAFVPERGKRFEDYLTRL